MNRETALHEAPIQSTIHPALAITLTLSARIVGGRKAGLVNNETGWTLWANRVRPRARQLIRTDQTSQTI